MNNAEITILLQIGTDKEDIQLCKRIESDWFNGEIIAESYEVVGFMNGEIVNHFGLTKSEAIVKYDVLSCEILTKYNEKRLATYAAMN